MPVEEGNEGERPRGIAAPYRPTAQEVEEHNLTHCPPRSWCDHCVKGQSKDQQHRLSKGEWADSSVARVNLDYFFIKDDVTTDATEHHSSETARVSMTCLCMQESACHSVWGYAVQQKGAGEKQVIEQIADDIATVGLSQERIIVKSDQEVSITDVQNALVKARAGFGTAVENSRVGDSNSNGRIERAIQDIKGLIRTLRSFVEFMTGGKIELTDPIVPWMVRHAGMLITRSRIREDGRTAYQLIKGRRTTAKLVPFGETILFKIPKTQHDAGDFQDRWQQGVWVGFVMRTGEHVVATAKGVFSVSTVMRRSPGSQWSAELVKSICGSPQEPIPGTQSRRLQAFAKKFEDDRQEKIVYAPAPPSERVVKAAYIYKADVDKYGPTPRCPGCRAMMSGAKYRAVHSPACRLRFEELLQQTAEGKRRIQAADRRMTEAFVRESGMQPDQDPDEPEPKRQREEPGHKSSGGGGDGSTAAAPPNSAEEPVVWPAVAARERALRKRRAEEEIDAIRCDERGVPEEVSPSVRAALLGKGDRKRAAEDLPDDAGRGDDEPN